MSSEPSSAPENGDSRSEGSPDETGLADLLPYVAPLFVFLVLTSLESSLPSAEWYPLAYASKVLAVAAVAWVCRSTWSDLCPLPPFRALVLATMIGVIVFVLWIRLEGWYPSLGLLGTRTGFDPSSLAPGPKWLFIAFRLAGLVALIPLIEELFWRSFLIRWVINPDFRKVRLGNVTPLAAAITSALFGFSHPEWLPAILTGLLWAWLLWQTKSVSACVLSHAVANLALGIHVLATGDWKYW
jgi:CAAX prenyl protease-like protein